MFRMRRQAGRLLLETLGKQDSARSLLMDRVSADYRARLSACGNMTGSCINGAMRESVFSGG
jgi:hypothetical protein